jgi:hypothetical protein
MRQVEDALIRLIEAKAKLGEPHEPASPFRFGTSRAQVLPAAPSRQVISLGPPSRHGTSETVRRWIWP